MSVMEYTYELLEAKGCLAAGQYEDALAMLDRIPDAERDGAWFFLRAEIEEKLERYYDALHSLNRAVELDPKNKVYSQRLKEYRKMLRGIGVKTPAKGGGMVAGMAAVSSSACDSFKNKDFSGCGEVCCEGCGEGCTECCCEAACENCDCDCG